MKTATTTTFPAVLVAAVLLIAATCPAAIPDKVNYQVMLTDDLDNPLADQSVELVFRIYDDADAGTQLWTETHNTTTNSIGVVSVTLGETNSLSTVGFTVPLWLEVQVNGETLDPRRELVTSPYAFMAGDAEELGGQAAVDYALDADLSDPGTINQPGNPVDWTKLKNVPADFADGADDVGGSGDGHSLDAADGTPANVVYVDGDGIVSVQNVSNPELRIEATGGGDVGLSFIRPSASYGDYRFLNDSGRMYLQYDVDDGATWELTHYFQEDGALGLGRVVGGAYMLDVAGSGRFDERLDLYREGSASPICSLFDYSNQGAWFEGRDASGNLTYELRPDPNVGGAEFRITRNTAGDVGFLVNGNEGGTESTSVGIYGSDPDHDIVFRTGSEGDDSVGLPHDAISASEMLDEVGAGYAGAVATVNLTSGYSQLEAKTITAPASGYVLVIGSCWLEIDHPGIAEAVSAWISVSDTPDDGYDPADYYFTLPAGMPTATGFEYSFPVTTHGVFTVTAGTHTFYLVGTTADPGNVRTRATSLSVLYFPTAYGTMYQPTRDEAARGPLTPADIEAERSASIAANQARIDRELAEMRAEMERLRRELKEGQR